MTTLSPTPKFQWIDASGAPLAFGKLYTYAAGTTTPQVSYSSATGLAQNTNPVILDAYGSCNLWLSTLSYKLVLKDSLDSTIWTVDGVIAADITTADVNALIAVHNASTTAHYPASETQRGFVELATQAEVNTGTDPDRVVTPATLSGRTATETRTGVIELATPAEVEAGVDTTRAATAAGIQSLQATAAEVLAGTDLLHFMGPAAFAGNKLLANDGYYKFPGLFMVQWGTTAPLAGDTVVTITFPTAYTTTNYAVVATANQNIPGGGLVIPGAAVDNFTTTSFDLGNDYGSPTAFTWIAVGY